jgi:hypothetical protein
VPGIGHVQREYYDAYDHAMTSREFYLYIITENRLSTTNILPYNSPLVLSPIRLFLQAMNYYPVSVLCPPEGIPTLA